MKEIEVDHINLVQNRDEVVTYSASSGAQGYGGLREIRLEITKNNPPTGFLNKIHNTDSLLVVTGDGCIKTDDFRFMDYIFDGYGLDSNKKYSSTVEVELVLLEEPIYAENKEQILIDII